MENPAAIIVVGNIEPLMESSLDAPGLAVELQPGGSVEFSRREVGDEADRLGLVTLEVAPDAGDLGGKGEADLFGIDCRGAEAALLAAALVKLNGACLGGGGLVEGGNPPRGR
jgi:hypothetical protein